MKIERALGGVKSQTKVIPDDEQGISETYDIEIPQSFEEEESFFVCLIHINSHFYILWETIYSLSVFSLALLIPYYFATRNLHFLTDYQEDNKYMWFIQYFFMLDMAYNCLVQQKLEDESVTKLIKRSMQFYLVQRFPIDLISNFIFIPAIINKQIITDLQKQDFKNFLVKGFYEKSSHGFLNSAKALNLGRWLFYLKLLNIARISNVVSYLSDQIDDRFSQKKFIPFKNTFKYISSLSAILLRMLIVLHLITCSWLCLSKFGL